MTDTVDTVTGGSTSVVTGPVVDVVDGVTDLVDGALGNLGAGGDPKLPLVGGIGQTVTDSDDPIEQFLPAALRARLDVLSWVL